jgi:hypothetical protein
MILAYLLLLTGLTISAVAIYYSVVGLTAIFSAAAIPIMIMGVSLEVAKLVCATWIKQYWTQVPRLMKTYMVTAVVLLMLITSMGIFGFLSKAHNDQNLVSGDVQSKIAIYDEKIKTARDNIEADRKALRQMDEAVDQVMGRSSDEKGADKAVAIRRSQAKDRQALARDIETNQKIISTLNDEAAPIRAEVRKVEAEVGPIKYIAAFLYGTAPDAGMLEQAVSWIFIIIVVVFDPLAVIMLLAAQMTFAWKREEETDTEADRRIDRELKETMQDLGIAEEPAPEYEADDGPLSEDQIRQINELAQGYADKAREEELLDAVANPVEYEIVGEEHDPDYYDRPTADSSWAFSKSRTDEQLVDVELTEVTPPMEPEPQRIMEAAPGKNRGIDVTSELPETVVRNKITMPETGIQADNGTTGKAGRADFGNEFPGNPDRGDVYLRTDYLPNRLFKFNGSKWIEVDKTQTDVYAYDDLYIQHLISEIDAGRYDPDQLSDVERQQIQQYLEKNA